MFKIVAKRVEGQDPTYTLHTPEGDKMPCKRWYEKKTDKWHIVLPKDNPSGRTYIAENLIEGQKEYIFEAKLTGPRILGGNGGWRGKCTPEELKQIESAELTIASIKEVASARVVEKLDPNSIEGLEAQIVKLTARLNAQKVK